MQETTLPITGMTCQGCVKSVTNALRQVPGVEDAEVLLDTASARIRFDALKTSIDKLKIAIEAAGFDVR